jgi:hypothetical protein
VIKCFFNNGGRVTEKGWVDLKRRDEHKTVMKIAEQDVFSKCRKRLTNFLMMDFAWIIHTVILNNSVTVASSNLSKFAN